MKKVAILTMVGSNLGNRLQNYALQTVLENIGCYAETLLRNKNIVISAKQFIRSKIIDDKYTRFYQFNKKIHWSKYVVSNMKVTNNLNEKYDVFIVGSDQVWNPTFNCCNELDYLPMIDPSQKFAYSASFGISVIPEQYKQMVRNGLMTFASISVREDAGVDIVKELTGKRAVVTLDPTLLLSKDDWKKIENPISIKNTKGKYILKYFLGQSNDKIIKSIAHDLHCNVIDATNKKLPIGPAEFVYLVDNAEIILTDSFHASVFSFIFQKPFIIFDRVDENKDMTSRLDTLCNKFNLKGHRFKNSLLPENFLNSYESSFALLNAEREKSLRFLKSML